MWPWDKYSRDYLDHYLVSDVEDPRVNFQSILTRALLIDTIFPQAFNELIDLEWRFGLCCTWLVKAIEGGAKRKSLLDALDGGDTTVFPRFVLDMHAHLQHADCPIPDFITDALMSASRQDGTVLSEHVLDTFMYVWSRAFAGSEAETIRVLEPACGSANDYRFLDECGLARFLDYVGFDMSHKNIENAHGRFAGVPFMVADAGAMPFDDKTFDVLFVHDLFEHLPAEWRGRALREMVRVTRGQAFLSFFDLAEPDGTTAEAPTVQEIEHSLRLAEPVVQDIEVIDIASLVREKFAYDEYYNPRAMTFVVTM